MALRILVLHGPNLNLLGAREPDVYGRLGLAEVNALAAERAAALGAELTTQQSNHEGVLIDALHAAGAGGADAVVLNPAGLTHTSVALRDAVGAVQIPVVEVHLSNTAAREEFRQRSLIAPVAAGTIAGFGPLSYVLGVEAAVAAARSR
jgi:3-dehydroquinate dehydratase-2